MMNRTLRCLGVIAALLAVSPGTRSAAAQDAPLRIGVITGETVLERLGAELPDGTVKKVDGKLTLINIKYYPPSQISPPDGIKSVDWIRSGFKR